MAGVIGQPLWLLAIAHNGNLPNRIMIPLEAQNDGRELDKSYVTGRTRWELFYEIMQMKGDGEAHPFLSSNDEFADYENWEGEFRWQCSQNEKYVTG